MYKILSLEEGGKRGVASAPTFQFLSRIGFISNSYTSVDRFISGALTTALLRRDKSKILISKGTELTTLSNHSKELLLADLFNNLLALIISMDQRIFILIHCRLSPIQGSSLIESAKSYTLEHLNSLNNKIDA